MEIIEINNLFNKKDTTLRDEILEYLDKSQNELEKILKSNNADINVVKFLVIDTYNFNVYHSYVGLKILTTPDDEFWGIIDGKMEESISSMFTNKDLYDRILSIIKKNKIQESYKNFLSKIIDSFTKKGINKNITKILKIKKMLKNNENKIMEKLGSNNIISLDKKLLNHNEQGKIQIELSRENYFFLINSISDAEVRSRIESVYNSRTSNVITDICKIIILRQYYANELGFKSYFDFVNDGRNNSNDIKELITDLINKVNPRTTNEMERIHMELSKDGFNKKVESNDIIYYHNKLQSKKLFKPSDVFSTIFDTMKKYFNISFMPISCEKWNKNVITFLCTDSGTGKKLGILYLDIMYSQSKKVDSPLFLKLSDRYTLGNSTNLVEMCILGNYKDINVECMSYNNIVLMFREFGHVLQNVSYESHTGLINYDDAFCNFLPQIMEYIAWERDTIEQIAVGCNDEMIDHILFGRNIDICYSIKIRCIQASIDHIIHNSKEFVSLVNDSIKQSTSANNIFIDLYKKTFKEMTDQSKDILNTELSSIPPHVVVQMINGSEGILYGNISSEILSYAAFSVIKNGKGIEFRNKVLKPTNIPFNVLLTKFISSIDTDTYNLYLSKIIGLDVQKEDEIVTENTNFFDDKESDSESDVDDIIIMSSRKKHNKNKKSNNNTKTI